MAGGPTNSMTRNSGRARNATNSSATGLRVPRANWISRGLSKRKASRRKVHVPARTWTLACPNSSTLTGMGDWIAASFHPSGSRVPRSSSRLLPATVNSTSWRHHRGIPSSRTEKSFTPRKLRSVVSVVPSRRSQSSPWASQAGFSTTLPSRLSARIPSEAGIRRFWGSSIHR